MTTTGHSSHSGLLARCEENRINLTFDTECEADGRWIAEVPELPGVLVYGVTEGEAVANAESLARRVLADRIEHGEAN
jgi:predicted RNase H-like HicB family nuclease